MSSLYKAVSLYLSVFIAICEAEEIDRYYGDRYYEPPTPTMEALYPRGLRGTLKEINLEPSDNIYGSLRYESGLMRVAFARGNPSLAKKLYGGPVLSDSETFRSMLMKEKIGIDNWNKDYHNYTMIWKPDGLELFVDGEQYGNINPGEGFFSLAREHAVPHASNWLRGTVMAPLDETFYLSLGLRVGGVHDFSDDLPDKPWRNRASKAMLDFWKHKNTWFPSWYNTDMRVDSLKVYAL